jgi:hypothetical protein
MALRLMKAFDANYFSEFLWPASVSSSDAQIAMPSTDHFVDRKSSMEYTATVVAGPRLATIMWEL